MKKSVLILILFSTFITYGQDYPMREVRILNDSVELSGILSYPAGEGPFPALLLIAGSGAQDRDSNLMGFKLFEIMANYFNESGFAVLRYDERGVGKSKGPPVMMSTTQDLSEDANAAINFLLSDDKINKYAIGILGHSEGGAIAPKVAVMNPEVDFIILLAGYGIPGIKVSEFQVRMALESDTTLTKDYINAMVATNTKLLQYAIDDSLTEEKRLNLAKTAFNEAIDKMSEKQLSGIANREVYAESHAKNALKQASIPWVKYFLKYDPQPTLSKIKVPVLLLFGEKDQQVTVEQNKDVMLVALKAAGNNEVTLKVFEDANHLFQKAETGSPSEYFSLNKEFIPELLPFISSWVLERVK